MPLKLRAELKAQEDRDIATQSSEANCERSVHVHRTEIALLEATALDRHSEVAAMQSRLSQGQRQADRDTLHKVTSFQYMLQKHREVLDSEYRREVDSLRNQVAMFASSSDDRTRALVQEINVITLERNQAKQELEQYRKELSSVQAAAKLQVEQTS